MCIGIWKELVSYINTKLCLPKLCAILGTEVTAREGLSTPEGHLSPLHLWSCFKTTSHSLKITLSY